MTNEEFKLIYFIILSVLIVFTYIESLDLFPSGQTGRQTVLYVLAAGLVCMLAACRYEVGQDWSAYSLMFKNCNKPSYWANYEHGYILLNRLFKSFSDNYYILQFFIDVVCGFIIFREFFIKSKSPLFIVFVYYVCQYNFSIDMTMNRMHLALAVIVLGHRFIEDRKLLLWIVSVMIAMQFHVTAIAAFPLYWTSKIKISRKICYGVLLAAFVLTIHGMLFTNKLLSFVQTLTFLPKRFSNIMNSYLVGDLQGRHQALRTGVGFIVELIIYLFIVLAHDKDDEKSKNIYMLNFMIAILIKALSTNFDLLKRFANYYMIAGFGILSYNMINEGQYVLAGKIVFDKDSLNKLKIIALSLFIAFKVLAYILAWKNSYSVDYLPYRVFFLES